MQLPKVFFSKRAYSRMAHEATRWYNRGMKEKGKPFESVGFPLSAVRLRREAAKGPVEMIELADIQWLIITHMAIPPDFVKNYAPTRANFKKEGADIRKAAEFFHNKRVAPIIDRNPCLSVISRLHSHPFSGRPRHSGGDLRTIGGDEVEAYSKGFDTSFSFLFYPERRFLKKEGLNWKVVGFAFDCAGKEYEVEVETVPEDHPLVARTLLGPYYLSGAGIQWELQLEATLEDRKIVWKKTRMRHGWTSYGMHNEAVEAVLCIPPFFPDDRMMVYSFVDDRCSGQTSFYAPGGPELLDIELPRLINRVGFDIGEERSRSYAVG